MQKLHKERAVFRRIFTKSFNTLQEFMDASDIQISNVETAFLLLKSNAERLFEVDRRVQEQWLADDSSNEDEIINDHETAEEYYAKWITLKCRYDKLNKLQKGVLQSQSNVNVEHTQTNINSNGESKNVENDYPGTSRDIPYRSTNKNFKLPVIELLKFDGNVKNWLLFWGQFKKIHEDPNIDDDDKYQYLIQATEPGTHARELVESFPPSGPNYYKAIEHMKMRFAKDEFIIINCIREILNLVLLQSKQESICLRSLYDKLSTQLRALESLGVTTDKYAAMLYPLIESAIPVDILRAWTRQNKSNDELDGLLNFIRNEVESEERVKIAKNIETSCVTPTVDCYLATKNQNKQKSESECTLNKNICIWCDKNTHNSSQCYKAAKMPLEEKHNYIKKKRGCTICLKVGHYAKICKSFTKCIHCAKRHNIIMCPDLGTKKCDKVSVSNPKVLCNKNNTTYLQTMLIYIVHNNCKYITRLLLDSGSQRSYVRADITEKLGLPHTGIELVGNCLFGGVQTKVESRKVYEFTISNVSNCNSSIKISALSTPKICGKLPFINNTDLLPLLSQYNITLSDVHINDNDTDIGILLGADFLGCILCNEFYKLNNNTVVIKTKLGWTLQGPLSNNCISMTKTDILTSLLSTNNIDLSDLWNLESLGIKDPSLLKSQNEINSETMLNFRKSITFNREGRYEVRLPWKEGYPVLLNNFELAKKRLESSTKRLITTGNLIEYNNIFKEWLKLHIIEEAPDQNVLSGHYIPHHAVIKEASLTTKIRPVFDASCKDYNGVSLNTCLQKGENFLELIPKLLINFRKGFIGVTSDIKKAFLQISVNELDRDYLKFLWWRDIENQQEKVIYRHRRVVFGVTSSPFLLSATLQYHLTNIISNHETLKTTAQKLLSSFYVDNCVTSVDSEKELLTFIDESKEVMSKGNFELRGWISSPIKVEKSEITSILGVMWCTKTDELYCNINMKSPEDFTTKRKLLSISQAIFDPIGFTAPTTLIPKLLLQKLCNLKIGWDDKVPECIQSDFSNWFSKLQYLKECRIPRRISSFKISDCDVSIHVFADACKYAYAGCVYIKTVYNGFVNVQLLLAKSRVAPLKQLTIPRLELMAALIAVRLFSQIKESDLLLNLSNYNIFCWTDSSVVMAWIKDPERWKAFVSNRVKEILQHTTSKSWFHLPGKFNPADLLSRGCDPQMLIDSQWWLGPEWLKLPQQNWPKSELNVNEKEVQIEQKVSNNVNTVVTNIFSLNLCYFSKYNKIIRMIAWVYRFYNNINKMCIKNNNSLKLKEINEAELKLFSLIQKENYGQSLELKPSNKLNYFKDELELLRVKSRLTLSEEDEYFISPIVLPGSHFIIKCMVRDLHYNKNHAGTQMLMSILRERFWIVGVRKLVKKTVRECVICRRFKAKCGQTPLAPLPLSRITCGKAFEITGVDLAGPLILRSKEKCWIIIFTCAVYRAVHLELANSMSTECFLMALRRFISRRGRINEIFSDNGRNFVGAHNYFKNVDWDNVTSQSSIKRIKWNFIPPAAPWWGGWWERMVRIVKDLLHRTLGKSCVNFVELETILCECESVINSRPLTYVSDNTENLIPLTPSMFLQPLPCNDVTDINFIDSNSFNVRLNYLQKLRADFRQRFRSEYLSTLLQKGNVRHIPVKVGDVVLLECDSKRTNWPLGLVLEVMEGIDGHARVAKVKTASGVRIRPFQKLYPLELSSSDTFNLISKSSDIKPLASLKPLPSPPFPAPHISRSGRVIKVPERLNL